MRKIYSGKGDFLKFQKSIPKEKEYDEVEALDFLNWARDIKDEKIHTVYFEMLAKLCYICSNKLILYIKTETGDGFTEGQKNNREGIHPRLVDNMTLTTPLGLGRKLERCGFELKLRQIKDKGLEMFVSERMPKLVWDGKKSLKDYKSNTVVEVPLFDFPHYKKHFWPNVKKLDEEEGFCSKAWWRRVDEIVKNFKPWLFLPAAYCKELDWRHAGAHRFVVARELGMKTIDIRIEQYKWWGGAYEV